MKFKTKLVFNCHNSSTSITFSNLIQFSREARRDKKKLSHFVKLNHHGEKVMWFRDNLDSEAEQYTPAMVDELIEKLVSPDFWSNFVARLTNVGFMQIFRSF